MNTKFGSLTVFLVVVLCVGCGALFARYNRYMDEWKGRHEEEVYLIYGPPMREKTLADGRKLVAYDYASPGSDTNLYCEVRFTIQDSIVSSATYDGNFGAVERYVKGPRNDMDRN